MDHGGTEDDASCQRRVRSFVRREGRLTRGQQRALDEWLPRFGIAAGDDPIDFGRLFGRQAPVTLEIGFGNGESLAQQAQAHPERDFIGIEVHRPGVGHLLVEIERRGLDNVRVLVDDAVGVLERRIPPSSLDALQVFFPDPWHKKRHHKRRLVQPAFLRLAASRLQPGGRLHLATDWLDYAEHMTAALAETRDLLESEGAQPVTTRPEHRPETRFERRGQRLGHAVHDFLYRRRIPPPMA
jgi:tRNA (guanine-N7-)-methyltransferase